MLEIKTAVVLWKINSLFTEWFQKHISCVNEKIRGIPHLVLIGSRKS
jgi:hypothetical protein